MTTPNTTNYRVQGSAQTVTFMGGFDPSAGDGLEGELAQVFIRTDIVGLYTKTGVLDTNWTLIASGVLPGDVAYLDIAQTFTKGQAIASVVMVANPITHHFSTSGAQSNSFLGELTDDSTLLNPTNLVSGGTYIYVITQDVTGGHTLSFGNLFTWPGGTPPTVDAGSLAVSVISCFYDGVALRGVGQLAFS